MATVSQYLSDWLTLRSSALKPRTVESYADLFRRYVFPAFDGVELSALDPSEITHLLASIVAAGHTRTAELLFVALKAAFRTLEKNPLHRVPRPRHSQQSPVAWDDAQIAVYMGALVGHKHRLALTLDFNPRLPRGRRQQDIPLFCLWNTTYGNSCEFVVRGAAFPSLLWRKSGEFRLVLVRTDRENGRSFRFARLGILPMICF